MDAVRAFIAIDLPQDIRRLLRRRIEVLKEALDDTAVRWVRPEAVHLTLRFLGETRLERVTDLKSRLENLARGEPVFSFKVGGLGCFPNMNTPRVVWLGVQEESGALLRLQRSVEDMCREIGFAAERRGFSPHLTLGRVRRGAEAETGIELARLVGAEEAEPSGRAQVDEVVLFQSELRPEGAIYRRLAVARLGEAQ